MNKARINKPTRQDQHANTPGPTCQNINKPTGQDQQTYTPGPTCQHAKTSTNLHARTNKPTRQDQHANTPGPTCQHIRTNMQTHTDQPKLTEKKTRLSNKQEILNFPK